MKLHHHGALRLRSPFPRTPAAAQYERRASTPQLPTQSAAQARENGAAQAQTEAYPSGKALKAIVELQKAVNANDTASIPAKLAAAQAVASTKEDRYIIAQLQLKAAYAANDDAALAKRDRRGRRLRLRRQSREPWPNFTSRLAASFYNAKKFDAAATAFEHASTLNPSNTQASDQPRANRASRGPQGRCGRRCSSGRSKLRTAAGQKPEEALYKRALGIAYGEQMPSRSSRRGSGSRPTRRRKAGATALAIYQKSEQADVEGALDVLRLMRATGSLIERVGLSACTRARRPTS